MKWILLFLPFFLFTETTKISLFTFNDSYELLPSKDGKGGLASMMSLLEKERKKSPHHLTALNGDFISPLYLGSWDQGAHLIDVLNRMKVDFALLGNHEFDYGSVELKKRIHESSFSWIASNLIEISGKPFSGNQLSKIYDFDGVKIGIFGLVHMNRQVLSDQGYDLLFLPFLEVTRQVIGDLRKKGAEVLVAFTDLPMSEDRELARQFPEIDLIIGGHEGGPIFWYEGGTFIYRPSYDDQYLTRIDLMIEKSTSSKGKRTQVVPCFRTILNQESNPSKEISDQIDFYYKKFNVSR